MADTLDRLKTALQDRYTIERELGAGGMATVYLAEDLKHHRKVAVKVLRPELAAVLGAERFVQEITTTANLQHPHILPLFDSGEADGFLYYVMPFIDGETLRDKLNRETQLGIEEAVKITTEVADALDYAHGQHVIHRDIKPENILLHNGRPMVADFGIALAVSAAAGNRMTETGLSLGTPHYMSPEQATAEKDLTNRSDIYSLGCVLYEMLTGEPPHMGNSAQQIIMKIVTDEARPVAELRKSVPPNVAAATAKALEKLPADRLESAKAFAEALTNPSFVVARATTGLPLTAPLFGRPVVTATLVVLVVTFCALAIWGWLREPGTDSPPTWLDIQLPDSAPMTFSVGAGWAYRALALSRDGRRLAYVAALDAGTSQLYARSLEIPTFRPLAGTEGAVLVEFSPDGEWIAFVANQKLSKVAFGGGEVVTLADVDLDGFLAGLAWSSSSTIIASYSSGLVTYDATTGAREPTAALCETIRRPCRYPDPLPDGEWVLVSSYDDFAIVSMFTGERRTLLDNLFEPEARLLPSGDIAFFQRPDELFVLPFDVTSREPQGPPIPVLQGVRKSDQGQYSVSAEGTLVYAEGHHHLRTRLMWVDREGRETTLPFPPESHGPFNLSPDGKMVAVALYRQQGQVWLYDLEREDRYPLTSQGFNSAPVWSPAGDSIAFVSLVEGGRNSPILATSRDGTTAPRTLIADGGYPLDWAADGRLAVVRVNQGPNLNDVWVLHTDGAGSEAEPLAVGEGAQDLAQFSPDGRWVAYNSTEMGRGMEVFVRRYPTTEERWKISVGGGFNPRWSTDGGRLYFMDLVSGGIYEVGLPDGPTQPGLPRLLLPGPYRHTSGSSMSIAPDGQRFLVLKAEDPRTATGSLRWVENWMTHVKTVLADAND